MGSGVAGAGAVFGEIGPGATGFSVAGAAPRAAAPSRREGRARAGRTAEGRRRGRGQRGLRVWGDGSWGLRLRLRLLVVGGSIWARRNGEVRQGDRMLAGCSGLWAQDGRSGGDCSWSCPVPSRGMCSGREGCGGAAGDRIGRGWGVLRVPSLASGAGGLFWSPSEGVSPGRSGGRACGDGRCACGEGRHDGRADQAGGGIVVSRRFVQERVKTCPAGPAASRGWGDAAAQEGGRDRVWRRGRLSGGS